MKKPSGRALRIGEQIQRELSAILLTEVKDRRVGRVTITAVEVSPDLAHAKVFFTHLAGKEHAPGAREALEHTAGFLRGELGRRMKMYSVPALHFAYDDSIESGIRLTRLIDEAVEADRRQHRE